MLLKFKNANKLPGGSCWSPDSDSVGLWFCASMELPGDGNADGTVPTLWVARVEGAGAPKFTCDDVTTPLYGRWHHSKASILKEDDPSFQCVTGSDHQAIHLPNPHPKFHFLLQTYLYQNLSWQRRHHYMESPLCLHISQTLEFSHIELRCLLSFCVLNDTYLHEIQFY